MLLTKDELLKVIEEFFESKKDTEYFYRHEFYDGVEIQLDGTYNLRELADKILEALERKS